ncbi:MAG: tRNA pseudouridine(13) synthase TruD [Candidatus Aenigmatarchaeota archaeon]|nr:tRNA pseudouridine(13) synthase TruD [Candidatus Aenigmarchaeota archaeon]
MFTKSPGIGGRIRQRIEDFQVDELPKSSPPGDEYTIFWLEKFNWDTHRAIRAIADRLHVSEKRFGIAGTKDRRAVTRQRVSVWKIEPEQLERLQIRGLKLYNFSKSAERINLGDLEGNKFIIIIRDINLTKEETESRLKKLFIELEKGIPNLFGSQRFGEVRAVTADVGRAIIKGDLEGAVKIYLTKVFEDEPDDAKIARNFLAENWGSREAYLKALEMFPKRLHFERTMLDALVKTPTDFAGALRKLPKRLRKMFINAVQAELFNSAVSWYVKTFGLEQRDVPLVGYDTVLNMEDPLHKKISELMAEQQLSIEQFRLPHSPELSTTGGTRKMLLLPRNLRIMEIVDDDFNPGKKSAKISFELPSGCYASVVLSEIMKSS